MDLIQTTKIKIKQLLCSHDISTKAFFDENYFTCETSCDKCGKRFPHPERIKRELDNWERRL